MINQVTQTGQPVYVVEHHDRDGISPLGSVAGVAPHHSSLEPFISQLLRKGAEGTVVLILQDTGKIVARRVVKPFATKGGDRFLVVR